MNALEVDKTQDVWYKDQRMHSDEYLQALAKTIELAQRDIAALEGQRAELQQLLADKEREILKRQREVEGFVSIWKSTPLGEKPIGDIAPLARVGSLNEAVSYVLRVADRRMSPVEIRDRLEQWGYDTRKYETSLISTLHTVLKRFVATGKVEEISEGHRRKSYKWLGKQDAHSATVVDAGNGNA